MIDPFLLQKKTIFPNTQQIILENIFYFKYGYTEDKERKTEDPQIVQKFEFI